VADVDEEQSLITDEHRAQVGVRTERTRITVTEEDATRMRDVLEDRDPRWADGTGAAPPYFLGSATGRPNRNVMPQVLPNGLLTQQEWRFNRHFRIGEELDAVSYLADIRERLGGRYGHSVIATMTTDYFDTDGKLVASSLSTFTQFDPNRLRKEES
jgi:hypothetical protein